MYPQNNHQGRSGDTLVTWQYLPTYHFSWDVGLWCQLYTKHFPGLRGNAPPSALLKPKGIYSSLLLHYLPLKQSKALLPSSSGHWTAWVMFNKKHLLVFRLEVAFLALADGAVTGHRQVLDARNAHLCASDSTKCIFPGMSQARDTPALPCQLSKAHRSCRALTAWAIRDFPPNSQALSWQNAVVSFGKSQAFESHLFVLKYQVSNLPR